MNRLEEESMTEAKKTSKSTAAKRSGGAAAPVKKAAPAKIATAAKKPAPPKAVATKVAPTKVEAVPKAKASRAPKKAKPAVSDDQRRNYIEVAAYYIAERRGFTPGDPMQDWIAAEAEIERLLREGLLGG